jgi:hypothetical protein
VTIALNQPNADEMDEVLDTLREWQQDETHVLLHPGDLGWFWRLSGDAAASATRTWRRDGHVVAIGLLDEPFRLRVAGASNSRSCWPTASDADVGGGLRCHGTFGRQRRRKGSPLALAALRRVLRPTHKDAHAERGRLPDGEHRGKRPLTCSFFGRADRI